MNQNSHLPEGHPKVSYGKEGVLLINLGTPDSYGTADIRKYLREFLSDGRVIEVPKPIWFFILNFIILPLRSKKTAALYKKIWFEESNESPLRYYTRRQAQKLQKLITDENIVIDYAMRYGNPSIDSQIKKLVDSGCDKITILPLYPQYSATTTASIADEVFRCLMKLRHQPSLKIIEPYGSSPLYIEKLADSIYNHMAGLDYKTDVMIASFHGLPQKYFDKGDPYYCYCHKTIRLLRQRLDLDESKLLLTFQSRFGKSEWLKPYTDKVVIDLAKKGIKNIVMVTPGFASDCLETLEEIAITLKETFIEHGGENFSVVPCLNDSDSHIEIFKNIITD